MKVSFLIPAYNEARTIGEVLDRIAALDLDAQMIVVDDGSTDDTAAIAEAKGALVIRQANRGKGAAIRAAIPHADGDIAVIQDADMEYDPADVPELIEPIVRGVADVVFGSRLSGGRPQRAYLFWHLVGNRFLSLLTNVLFNTTLSDMETGYKAFRIDVLRSLDLREDSFGDRARDHRPDLQAQAADLRAADLLLRPQLRRGQEDHLARRLPRDLGALPRAVHAVIEGKTVAVVVPALRRGDADRRDARRDPELRRPDLRRRRRLDATRRPSGRARFATRASR